MIPRLFRLLPVFALALAGFRADAAGTTLGLAADDALAGLRHPEPQVRLWTVRLLGDQDAVSRDIAARLVELAAAETNVEVRVQLAATARRLPAADGLAIVRSLLPHDADARDPRQPLMLWWAIEAKCESDRDAVLALFDNTPLWEHPLVTDHLLSRLMRRFASSGAPRDLLVGARLFRLAPARRHALRLMEGLEEALKGQRPGSLPAELIQAMARWEVGSDAFQLQAGNTSVLARVIGTATNRQATVERRQEAMDALASQRLPAGLPALLWVLRTESSEPLLRTALLGVGAYDQAEVAAVVLGQQARYSAATRAAALNLLATRPAWATQLVAAVVAGRLPATSVPPAAVNHLRRLPAGPTAASVAQLWPDRRQPTTAAMQARMEQLAQLIRTGTGDPYNGKKLFTARCATCHILFAQGGRVGPDLTAYQRTDLGALLLNIVNPNAEIREGYEAYNLETRDDRSLTGFILEQDARAVTLRGTDDQLVTVPRADIRELSPASGSLMPEALIDDLDAASLRDLFAYLRSTQPLAN